MRDEVFVQNRFIPPIILRTLSLEVLEVDFRKLGEREVIVRRGISHSWSIALGSIRMDFRGGLKCGLALLINSEVVP